MQNSNTLETEDSLQRILLVAEFITRVNYVCSSGTIEHPTHEYPTFPIGEFMT